MATISPAALKARLGTAGAELAFLDVREFGEYGMSHPFHVVNLPLSRLEAGITRLVPRLAAPIVVMDRADEGRARHAQQRLSALGYRDVAVLAGGIEGWTEAGFGCFAGVNVVSKTFGELAHERFHTPVIDAETLAAKQARHEPLHIFDGRPLTEYHKMNIPGSVCCPNGELARRLPALLDGDPETPVVINCAGRTRSIVGAQTLRWLGIDNPVYALENGTQGWRLAGLELEHGSQRRYPARAPVDERWAQAAQTTATAHGARAIDTACLNDWLADETRTTYLFDVRTAEEYHDDGHPEAVHAPGGQLIQATDHWVGVYRARIVLLDDDACRAPMVAAWLALMGHEVAWLEAGRTCWGEIAVAAGRGVAEVTPDVPTLEVAAALNSAQLLDLQPGMAYRQAHLRGARWVNRALLETQLADLDPGVHTVLVGDAGAVACLLPDLKVRGFHRVKWLPLALDTWRSQGIDLVSTPESPADAECIDYLFFVHDRHDGNLEASRRYLAWETGLLAQLDAEERATFAI